MIRTGYIVDRRNDLIWFLGLPLFALAFALYSQFALSAVAIASIALWIEYPHHFVTFLRTYGLSDDWDRFKDRLIIGPIVIVGVTLGGLMYAPLTITLVMLLWRQQHFLMQLHGFTRIYDFKARTGDASIGKWDLALNWVLYLNMFLASPLFTRLWARNLTDFGIPINADTVRIVHQCSWAVTAAFAVGYVGHLLRGIKDGYAINPIKYLYLGLSYSMLYIVSWHTASVLVHAVANMIIHGIQYNVIVYWYLRRKFEKEENTTSWIARLVRPGNVVAFVALGVLYAVIYQLLRGGNLDEFGFGLFRFEYASIPALSLGPMSEQTAFELFASTLLFLPGLLHIYFDSFIWRVRETKVQGGL